MRNYVTVVLFHKKDKKQNMQYFVLFLLYEKDKIKILKFVFVLQ